MLISLRVAASFTACLVAALTPGLATASTSSAPTTPTALKAPPPPAPSEAFVPLSLSADREKQGLIYNAEGMSGEASKGHGRSSKDGAQVEHGSVEVPAFYLVLPRVRNLPDGDSCAESYRRYYPDASSRDEAAALIGDIWGVAARNYPRCEGSAPPAATPALEAADYWRVAGQDLLPKPAPRIAPGWMLAGKTAYLETGSRSTAHFEHPTPLGLLAIDATATLFVDWGDGGKPDGPLAGPGGPWPNGTITHFWTTARTYDVTVTQQWAATWHLGTSSGELADLTTRGTIDDFEVRQLQAVRNS